MLFMSGLKYFFKNTMEILHFIKILREIYTNYLNLEQSTFSNVSQAISKMWK